jgi:hypothetical protein
MAALTKTCCIGVTLGVFWFGALPIDDLGAAEIEARAVLAMPVSFDDETSAKLSSSVVALWNRSTVVEQAGMSDWNDIQRQCHLSIKYQPAHRVPLLRPLSEVGEKSLEVDELIVTFPLSSGRVYVRSGEKVYWFAKWPGTEMERLCGPIQKLLSNHD